MEQTTPVSELVVLSRRIEVEHEFLHTWVGSSKRVKLHGTFIAKAGFDLQQTCRSIFARMKSSSSCRTPESLVSSRNRWTSWHLKMDCGTAFQDRICKANYRSCLQLAREKAAESDLSAEAESALQQQIEQRVHAPQPVHLIFKDEKQRVNE